MVRVQSNIVWSREHLLFVTQFPISKKCGGQSNLCAIFIEILINFLIFEIPLFDTTLHADITSCTYTPCVKVFLFNYLIALSFSSTLERHGAQISRVRENIRSNFFCPQVFVRLYVTNCTFQWLLKNKKWAYLENES